MTGNHDHDKATMPLPAVFPGDGPALQQDPSTAPAGGDDFEVWSNILDRARRRYNDAPDGLSDERAGRRKSWQADASGHPRGGGSALATVDASVGRAEEAGVEALDEDDGLTIIGHEARGGAVGRQGAMAKVPLEETESLYRAIESALEHGLGDAPPMVPG